jgi:hypothetical protein
VGGNTAVAGGNGCVGGGTTTASANFGVEMGRIGGGTGVGGNTGVEPPSPRLPWFEPLAAPRPEASNASRESGRENEDDKGDPPRKDVVGSVSYQIRTMESKTELLKFAFTYNFRGKRRTG